MRRPQCLETTALLIFLVFIILRAGANPGPALLGLGYACYDE